MQLRPEQLEAALARGLKPLYTIHGDEPLLAQEAADAIRAAARTAGYSETAALAKEHEEAELFREMQSDIVAQVLRRLAAVTV